MSAQDKKTVVAAEDDDGVEVQTRQETSWCRQLLAIKNTLIIVLTPILLLPIFLASTSIATRCAYSVLIIAVFWCTECLPMSVTALLPVVLMTWLGVMDSKDICKNYLKDANFLFLGALLISVAVEKWGLHKRVALRVLLLVGSKPVWITFGFMVVTGFLSMWLPNIPTTAMMIPIAAAVLKELDAHRKNVRQIRRNGGNVKGSEETQRNNNDEKDLSSVEIHIDDEKRRLGFHLDEQLPLRKNEKSDAEMEKIYAQEDSDFRDFSCALKLSVTYAASVGGLGTIIGSGPNIVFKGQIEALYGPNTGINFFSFFIFAFPLTIILLPLTWLSLMVLIMGPRKAFVHKETEEDESGELSANAVIKKEYEKLGRMSWTEAWIAAIFITLAVLWITKEPQFVPGWGSLMTHRYVTDSSVAVSVAILLFLIPSRPPNYLCFRRKSDTRPPGPAPAILDWPTVHKDMQWGVLLLLGGGFAIADACKTSNLSAVIASFLSSFKSLPPPFVVFIVTVMAVICTTFTANAAIATLILPIAAELANGIEVNPIYIMFPVTLAVSFSYLLPVSTPSNAMVYAYGDITVADMLKVGFFNCILHVLVLQLAINTWGYALFDLGTFPEWARVVGVAKSLNGTLAASLNGTDSLESSVDWFTTTAVTF